jgi:hypothetical protein
VQIYAHVEGFKTQLPSCALTVVVKAGLYVVVRLNLLAGSFEIRFQLFCPYLPSLMDSTNHDGDRLSNF